MSVILVSNIATASITHHEFFVESAYDGLKISVLEVIPAEKSKAVVLLAHGLCGCKERFLPFMEFLSMNGIACVANDHRGHGGSILCEEDRGYTYQGGAKALVMDMETVADYITEHYQETPITLLGHSMGSLAARAFLKHNENRLNRVIICGSPSPNPMAPIGRVILNIKQTSHTLRLRHRDTHLHLAAMTPIIQCRVRHIGHYHIIGNRSRGSHRKGCHARLLIENYIIRAII